MENTDIFIHSSSFVDDGAIIGNGTRIWHFCHILAGATIGCFCSIGQNVCVSGNVVIGDNVKIQNNVSVYDGVIIEDDVFLGPSCVFTNISNPRSQVSRKTLYEKTLVKKGASIGANATIVSGTIIGRYAFIAAGAVVTRNVPDYKLIQGVPGKPSGWMSRHGHRLRTRDKNGLYICPESGLRYREIDKDRLVCLDLDEMENLPKALAAGKNTFDHYRKKRDDING